MKGTIEDDAALLLGLAPYNGPDNMCRSDGYFDAACRQKWGETAWRKACEAALLESVRVANEEKELLKEFRAEYANGQVCAAAYIWASIQRHKGDPRWEWQSNWGIREEVKK